MSKNRCAATHPEDTSPCEGNLESVRVVDQDGAESLACVRHGAVLLASLENGRVYPAAGSPEGVAIRVFQRAKNLRPFAFHEPRQESPMIKKVGEFQIDEWFIDPVRNGRRPAKIIGIHGVRSHEEWTGIREPRLHLTLDDDTQWGPWVASYPAGTELLPYDPAVDALRGNPIVNTLCDILVADGVKTRDEADAALPYIEARLGELTPRERGSILVRFPDGATGQ